MGRTQHLQFCSILWHNLPPEEGNIFQKRKISVGQIAQFSYPIKITEFL